MTTITHTTTRPPCPTCGKPTQIRYLAIGTDIIPLRLECASTTCPTHTINTAIKAA